MNVHKLLIDRDVTYERIPHRRTCDALGLADELLLSGSDVAKTVMLCADHGYRYFVAVLPATEKVDLAKVSRLIGGSHIVLATEDDVRQHCPDCELGVLPPFGSIYGMETLVDKSLAENAEIVFAGGDHKEAIRMRYDDFIRIEEPLVADFSFQFLPNAVRE
ncbi:MAG: YbaK/EbsC family protein [bacterium]|nr:YbaK/EbsC family protein [bacterium]